MSTGQFLFFFKTNMGYPSGRSKGMRLRSHRTGNDCEKQPNWSTFKSKRWRAEKKVHVQFAFQNFATEISVVSLLKTRLLSNQNSKKC